MDVGQLTPADIPMMWQINEQGLPGTGKVNEQEMADLLTLSELSLGAYEDGHLVGFVLCLLPKTNYGSLNYAWFNQRYDSFLYIDRVAVASKHRNKGIGSLLYQRVISHGGELDCPVTAEVSSNPPNPGSMRFHFRNKFEQIGELHHESKSVTMMMRTIET